MIVWYSVFGIFIDSLGKLVNYLLNGKYFFNCKRDNFEQIYSDLMNRVDYMIKVRIKIVGDGDCNFGCSCG